MKEFKTLSDVGSFLFGVKDFSFLLNNNYGDTENTVIVFEDNDEFEKFCKRDSYMNFQWLTVFNGKFHIYKYDCAKTREDVAYTFDGKYDVYLYSDGYETPILALVKKGTAQPPESGNIEYYYISNTVDEYRSLPTGYYDTLAAARVDLANKCDWWGQKGSGTIHKVTLTKSNAIDGHYNYKDEIVEKHR